MTCRLLPSILAVAVVPFLPAFPSIAYAQDEPSAQELLKTGLEQMAAKKFAAGCPAIRKSYRLDPQVRTLFHLAECEDQAGHVATAAIHYEDYLEQFDKLSPETQREETEREQLATARREWLQRQIPRAIFKLPADAPANTVVTRRPQDGGEPVKVVVGVPLPIDPGEHFIAAEVPGRPRWEKRFFIQRGEQKIVYLEVPPASTSLKPAQRSDPLRPVPVLLPPLDPPMPARRIAAYAIGGVGIAGTVLGLVAGGVVWAQKGTTTDNCRDPWCNPAGQSAVDTANAWAMVSNISLPIGLACVGTAVILLVTEPEPTKFGAAPYRVRIASDPNKGSSLGMEWVW